jgi:hypothetical protein
LCNISFFVFLMVFNVSSFFFGDSEVHRLWFVVKHG